MRDTQLLIEEVRVAIYQALVKLCYFIIQQILNLVYLNIHHFG